MSQAAKLLTKAEPTGTQKLEHKWNNRILVVEDEREIGRLYQDILTDSGNGGDVVALKSSRQKAPAQQPSVRPGKEFEVTVVHSADEALAQIKHAQTKGLPFAMGFFDVLLGAGMDGIELVREIHKIQSSIYAVFVTAYNDRSVDSIRGVLNDTKSSHWDYLNKPFSSGEILQKARNFTSLWNLTEEKALHQAQLAEAHRSLLEHERYVSVAAVARGVSHEFGNILMQIMGKADLGRRKSEKDMRECLERILDASHRASEILDRFKHLSSPSEAHSRKQWVDIGKLVDEALDLMEHALKTHKVKACKIKMDSVTVMANATSLLQVFVNLIINAIHAMGTTGQMDFSVIKVQEGVEIRVRDYGPGIKAELLDRVLEPFFTTKGANGTGLGLAITKEIIEIEHRGEIKLQNHPVKGLEVVLRLPERPLGEAEDDQG
jgi:signal transduction histidine kinase